MKQLKDILTRVQAVQIIGDASVMVSSICIDSRKAGKGSVFVAVSGTQTDGHLFIDKAIELGAEVIVCERLPEVIDGVTYVQVKDSVAVVSLMADELYGNPTADMKVIGVTGTNGKTTVATLLFQLFSKLGYKCGLISTVQNHIVDKVLACFFVRITTAIVYRGAFAGKYPTNDPW